MSVESRVTWWLVNQSFRRTVSHLQKATKPVSAADYFYLTLIPTCGVLYILYITE